MECEEKGILLVLSGPSGSGKNTVLDGLMEKDQAVRQTVSATTRSPRPGEKDGVEYYFISREAFDKRIENGEFLEYVRYGNNYYGTLRAEIDRLLAEKKKTILVIEVNGAANIKKVYPDAITVFLMPPSDEVLRCRLCGRGEISEEEMATRMSIALEEVKHKEEYDYIVVNDVLEKAVDEVYTIMNRKIAQNKESLQ